MTKKVNKWLAVSAGMDAVKLVPLEGSGPDFFVKLADFEALQSDLLQMTHERDCLVEELAELRDAAEPRDDRPCGYCGIERSQHQHQSHPFK